MGLRYCIPSEAATNTLRACVGAQLRVPRELAAVGLVYCMGRGAGRATVCRPFVRGRPETNQGNVRRGPKEDRYSFYLFFWYKSTNTDAVHAHLGSYYSNHRQKDFGPPIPVVHFSEATGPVVVNPSELKRVAALN